MKGPFSIEQHYLHEMIAHALVDAPNEACGILAGKDGRIVKLFRTRNAEGSPVRYVVDPAEQLAIMRELEEKGWQLLGIYHSHTHTPAFPSQTDVEMAYFDDAIYFIVSLMNEAPTIRAFRIVNRQIDELELAVTQV